MFWSLWLLPLLALANDTIKPNIILLIVDDLGWNDVDIHGSHQIPTPHMRALATEGPCAILDAYYVQPVCSPTRATVLTGRHVIHTGVFDPMNGGSGDLSLNFTLVPAYLKRLNYSTHMVGKWHLGFSSHRFTPVARGFDSYFGYLDGGQDYWSHSGGSCPKCTLDFFNSSILPDFSHSCYDKPPNSKCPEEKYSANVFTQKAIDVIRAAAKVPEQPFFLYLAYQSVHSPDEAPERLIDRFNSSIRNDHRRTFAGMVTALDDGIGNVTGVLKELSLDSRTLLIFTTDNGGPADNFNGNMASNYPLRGMKRTLWEGGTRAVGFVHGAGLSTTPRKLTGFMHATDWMPTILSAAANGIDSRTHRAVSAEEFDPLAWRRVAGLETGEQGGTVDTLDASSAEGIEAAQSMPFTPPFQLGDGVDLWPYLSGTASSSPRTEVIYEAHASGSTDGNGQALRVGQYKILMRSGAQWSHSSSIGSNDGWYGGPGSSDNITGSYAVDAKDAGSLSVKCPEPPANWYDDYACVQSAKGAKGDRTHFCLFDLEADPCEHTDLSSTKPDILQKLVARLEAYQQTAVPSSPDPHSNPDGKQCPGKEGTGEGNATAVVCADPEPTPPPAPVPPTPPTPPPTPAGTFLLKAGAAGGAEMCLAATSAGDAQHAIIVTCSSVQANILGNGTFWTVKDAAQEIVSVTPGSPCLKMFKSPNTGGCDTWRTEHLGPCRGDGNVFTLLAAGSSFKLQSNACPKLCISKTPAASGIAQVVACTASDASGWATAPAVL
jgi:arylsulfatase A-like enzyme